MAQLSPLDLLYLSDMEQAIVNHLNRHPRSTITELVTATCVPLAELEIVIQQMVAAAQLIERIEGGKRVYLVQYQRDAGRTRSRSSSMLDLLE